MVPLLSRILCSLQKRQWGTVTLSFSPPPYLYLPFTPSPLISPNRGMLPRCRWAVVCMRVLCRMGDVAAEGGSVSSGSGGLVKVTAGSWWIWEEEDDEGGCC